MGEAKGMVECHNCGTDIASYYEIRGNKYCLGCYLERDEEIKQKRIDYEDRKFNELKDKVLKWKEEGYNIEEIEIMLEELE